jgi:hypothetical protein
VHTLTLLVSLFCDIGHIFYKWGLEFHILNSPYIEPPRHSCFLVYLRYAIVLFLQPHPTSAAEKAAASRPIICTMSLNFSRQQYVGVSTSKYSVYTLSILNYKTFDFFDSKFDHLSYSKKICANIVKFK